MEERECEQCQTPYAARWTKRRGWSRFCSRDCALKTWRAAGNAANAAYPKGNGPSCRIYIRSCPWCSSLFTASYRNKKWCSRACLKQYHNDQAKQEYRITHRPDAHASGCLDCGADLDAPYRHRCAICRAAARSAHLHRKNAADRLRKSGGIGITEPYTMAEIAARDRYRCCLCSKRVAMTKRVPHPRAPTIDHVVPWSISHDDTRANVQLAHFLCNCRKHTGGTQQLAMFG